MIYYISKQQEIGRKVYDLSILDNIDTGWIGADLETTGLDPFTLTPILLGIVSNNDYYIINLLTYSKAEIESLLLKFKDKLWIFHNAKYDIKVLKVHYNVLLENIFCTYVNHQIVYNGCTAVKHSYDAVVERLFNIKVDKTVRNSFINRDLSLPITNDEINYLVEDLKHLKPIYDREYAGLQKYQLLECSELENQFTPVLAQLELNGIKVDALKWRQNTKVYTEKVLQLESDIKKEIKNLSIIFPDLLEDKIGSKKKVANNQLSMFSTKEVVNTSKVLDLINIGSSSQMVAIFKKCGINLEDSGEETLNKHLLENPNSVIRTLVELLLQHREYNKLISSFGDTFLRFINPVTKLVHCDYFQNTTATGRLSCSNPNIQQIPGIKEIRQCFIPDDDLHSFVNIDLSGQELRLAASYSKDKILLASFNEGLDLHSYLAQGSFRIIENNNNLIVSKSENKDKRNAHKPIIFGALYGAGVNRISDVLNIPKEVATKVYNNLKLSLPDLFKYQDVVKKQSLKTKTIRCGSYINRVKRFNYLSNNETEDYKIEKESCNFPIQSSGASMLKLCTITLYNYFKDNNLDCKIKATVHDELIIQIPKDDFVIAEKIKEIMQNTANIFLNNIVMESEMTVANFWQH